MKKLILVMGTVVVMLSVVSQSKAITPGQPPDTFVPRPPPPAGMALLCSGQLAGTVWADVADFWRRKICP